MAGLGGGERGGHGLAIAHLSHQNDVGTLAQDGAYRLGEAGSVVADLDLLDDRAAIGVLVFDRDLRW